MDLNTKKRNAGAYFSETVQSYSLQGKFTQIIAHQYGLWLGNLKKILLFCKVMYHMIIYIGIGAQIVNVKRFCIWFES